MISYALLLLICLDYADNVDSVLAQVTALLSIRFFHNVEKLGRCLGRGTKICLAQEQNDLK